MQVLRALLHIMTRPPAVAAALLDFEAALWQALATELPDVLLKGCTFHFSQAIWRKVQELGLQLAYADRRRTHSFIRQVHVMHVY